MELRVIYTLISCMRNARAIQMWNYVCEAHVNFTNLLLLKIIKGKKDIYS